MSSSLYALGYLIVIVGVAYMAYLLKIPQTWIGAIVLVLIGIGILTAVQNGKAKG